MAEVEKAGCKTSVDLLKFRNLESLVTKKSLSGAPASAEKRSELGVLFGVMEQIRANYGVDEYSISPTSLEQIFNAFVTGRLDVDAPGPAFSPAVEGVIVDEAPKDTEKPKHSQAGAATSSSVPVATDEEPTTTAAEAEALEDANARPSAMEVDV